MIQEMAGSIFAVTPMNQVSTLPAAAMATPRFSRYLEPSGVLSHLIRFWIWSPRSSRKDVPSSPNDETILSRYWLVRLGTPPSDPPVLAAFPSHSLSWPFCWILDSQATAPL